MSTLLIIVVSVALGFSWGIQHEKKRIKKQIQKHGDLKRRELQGQQEEPQDEMVAQEDEFSNFNHEQ